jgi:Sulfotransferase family
LSVVHPSALVSQKARGACPACPRSAVTTFGRVDKCPQPLLVMLNHPDVPSPVAVGGIGGSGTRVVAALLVLLGYYLGDDLNEPIDNLWFTLLFKRRSSLSDSDPVFRHLLKLFVSRMSGNTTFAEEDTVRLFRLAERDQPQHARKWLIDRASSFCSGRTSKRPYQPWAWKEPNTHIVVDRIFRFDTQLKYIHVVRHPIDMATSSNQSQLALWGPMILGDEVAEITPRASLAFWCAAHRRITSLTDRWPARSMIVDYDALCRAPNTHCASIAGFVGVRVTDDVRSTFNSLVRRSRLRRFNSGELSGFDACDLEYVADSGYPL